MSEIQTKNVKSNSEFMLLSVLGMLLVMCGHFGSTLFTVNGIFPYDTFHVPMFFFISGYFYKEKYSESLKDSWGFTKKKLQHHLLPYYAWSVVYLIFAYVLQKHSSFHIFDFNQLSFKYFLLNPFQLANGFVYNVASWFLMTLFLCQLSNNWLRFLLVKSKILNNDIVKIVLFTAIGYGAILLSTSQWNSPFRISVSRTGYVLFYYNLGFYYKKYLEKYDDKLNDLLVLGFCVLASLLWVNHFGDLSFIIFDMTHYTTVPPIYFIMRAIVGIYFWLRIAKILAPRLGQNPLIQFASNHTFSLMMHQGVVGLPINGVLLYLTKNEALMDYYYSFIWMNPLGGNWGILVPCAVAVAVLILVYIYEWCKAKVLLRFAKKKECE